MPNLLAIDTASANCAVALAAADKVLFRSTSTARHAAQSVLPMIEDLLTEAAIGLPQLEAIAVLAGPGSFTGIRIGIGIAQGLGLANGTPVLPLSTLAVMAYSALQAMDAQEALVSVKARDEEVYFARYRRSSRQGVELSGQEQVAEPAALVLDSQSGTATNFVLVGDGWERRDEMATALRLDIADAAAVDPELNLSEFVQFALLRLALGEAVVAELATPNYVKENMLYAS
jgi:tRNA threonylcarbamoyladenosine biosynthesis protein TsaB